MYPPLSSELAALAQHDMLYELTREDKDYLWQVHFDHVVVFSTRVYVRLVRVYKGY